MELLQKLAVPAQSRQSGRVSAHRQQIPQHVYTRALLASVLLLVQSDSLHVDLKTELSENRSSNAQADEHFHKSPEPVSVLPASDLTRKPLSVLEKSTESHATVQGIVPTSTKQQFDRQKTLYSQQLLRGRLWYIPQHDFLLE